MTDRLEVSFAGVRLRNPIILGSATPSRDGESSKKGGLAGAGAIIPKTITSPALLSQHPRCGRLHFVRHGRRRPFGMVNTELYSTMPLEEWLNRELAIAAEGGAKIIASIVAEGAPEETVELARRVEFTDLVDMFELNVSCPVSEVRARQNMVDQNIEMVVTQTKAVKEATSLPVGVKMTPNVSDMVPIAQAAKDAGADFLTISNSVKSLAGVDIETGKPYLPAYGGYTGPAIKPIIQRFVSEVARAVDIPISAVGGVRSWEDVVEYIMLGATTIQTVTAVMWDGYEVMEKLISGLSQFMERKGYNSIEDFRGIALPHIITIQEYAACPRKHVTLEQENCDGCGLCVETCPRQALSLK